MNKSKQHLDFFRYFAKDKAEHSLPDIKVNDIQMCIEDKIYSAANLNQ